MATDPQSLYREPAYYGRLFAGRAVDLPFYRAVAALGEGPILEIGVGAGRVAWPLVEAGHEVVGVDDARAMLEAARAAAGAVPAGLRHGVTLHHADARTLDLASRFSRVLCPFNGLAHFATAADLAAFFRTVHRHLRPGGRFAFDVMIPDPALLAGGTSTSPQIEHPRTGQRCLLDETYTYDALAQVLTVTTVLTPLDGGEAQVLRLALRQFFPEETRLLLVHHGFGIDRQEHLGDSLAYLCRPAT
ncbi:MAG: class I SAM-dependent methyltransferase [Sandaracinaceae bacterium]